MSSVRGKDTKPEMVVRRLLHALGYRYRLHRKDLPGRPDIVFGGRHKVIFVHGCFWHRHAGCSKTTSPKTRRGFWAQKFGQNVDRDLRVDNELASRGWKGLTVWECETRDVDDLTHRLREFLAPEAPSETSQREQAKQ